MDLEGYILSHFQTRGSKLFCFFCVFSIYCLSVIDGFFMNSLGNSMSKNAKHYYVTITIFGIHVKWTKHVETSKFKFFFIPL